MEIISIVTIKKYRTAQDNYALVHSLARWRKGRSPKQQELGQFLSQAVDIRTKPNGLTTPNMSILKLSTMIFKSTTT